MLRVVGQPSTLLATDRVDFNAQPAEILLRGGDDLNNPKTR